MCILEQECDNIPKPDIKLSHLFVKKKKTRYTILIIRLYHADKDTFSLGLSQRTGKYTKLTISREVYACTQIWSTTFKNVCKICKLLRIYNYSNIHMVSLNLQVLYFKECMYVLCFSLINLFYK